MHIVDLFSGCGGLSCGAKLAGLDTSVGIEADAAAAASFAANNPNATIIQQLVEDVDPTTLKLPKGELIICGGPPCQGFSSSNQRNRNPTNPRNHLYSEMLRFADALRPKAFVFENVFGIIEGEKREVLNTLIAELRRRFSTVDWAVLNSAQYGVPQVRRRVFVVARRGRKSIRWPAVASGASVMVRDALDDLPILENGADIDIMAYRTAPVSRYSERLRGELGESTGHTVTRNADHIVDRYRHIPQGGNWRDIPDRFMTTYANKERCHTGIYRRLCLSAPSVVIGNFRKNMLIHPTQHRGLSIREAARLQSFPDTFVFCGSIGKRQQQVGNAVPPQLAAEVLSCLVNI